MKARISNPTLVFGLLLALAVPGLPQVPGSAIADRGTQVPEKAGSKSGRSDASPGTQNVAQADGNPEVALQSMLPRDKLKYYVEVRKGRFAELAERSGSLVPLFAGLTSRAAPFDALAALMKKRSSELSRSRLAIVDYGQAGLAICLEAYNEADARAVAADLAPRGGGGIAKLDLRPFSSLVFVGSKTTIAHIERTQAGQSLADDPEFLRAWTRFPEDQLLLYAILDSPDVPVGVPSPDAETYSSLPSVAGLGVLPRSLICGASVGPELTLFRALVVLDQRQSVGAGVLSWLMSASIAALPQAGEFATPESDLFVNLMIDWEHLYEDVKDVLGIWAAALAQQEAHAQPIEPPIMQPIEPPGEQPSEQRDEESDEVPALVKPDYAGLLAMAEASLGFSIKHDLIPTLGNEIAFSIEGSTTLVGNVGADVHPSPETRAGVTAGSGDPARAAEDQPAVIGSIAHDMKFAVFVAVRDETRFNDLMGRILKKAMSTASPFAQASHNGATIFHSKAFAYTVSRGFFVFAGSLGEVKRALDIHGTSGALASKPEFRAALGPPRPVLAQAYLGPNISAEFLKKARSEGAAKALEGESARRPPAVPAAIGIVATDDPDGWLLEARAPTELIFSMLAELVQAFVAAPQVEETGTPPPAAAPPAARPSRTPMMTEDDLRSRRP